MGRRTITPSLRRWQCDRPLAFLSYTGYMKVVWTILVAVLLAFSLVASAVPAGGCCPDDECGIVQCVDMGCVSTAASMVPPAVGSWPTDAGTFEYAAAPIYPSQSWYTEVWTPPD